MDLMQKTATFSYCFSQHLAQQIFKYSSEIKAVQKQPSSGVLRERCSENTQQVYRIIPMPKCDFNRRWLVSQTLLKRRSTKSFYYTLREKCPCSEFFWSVFSCIQTEYRGSRLDVSQEKVFWKYAVHLQEKTHAGVLFQ